MTYKFTLTYLFTYLLTRTIVVAAALRKMNDDGAVIIIKSTKLCTKINHDWNGKTRTFLMTKKG